jgi:uncharacterized membrane protein
MAQSTLVILALITLIMLGMDGVWLTVRAAYHRQVFAAIQGQPLQIRMSAAIAVYALMVFAVWFFAVKPATDWYDAAGRGAAIGLVMYGLYDLTNYATLTRYPLHFTLTDLAWGTFLCATTAGAAFAAAKYIPDLNWG